MSYIFTFDIIVGVASKQPNILHKVLTIFDEIMLQLCSLAYLYHFIIHSKLRMFGSCFRCLFRFVLVLISTRSFSVESGCKNFLNCNLHFMRVEILAGTRWILILIHFTSRIQSRFENEGNTTVYRHIVHLMQQCLNPHDCIAFSNGF